MTAITDILLSHRGQAITSSWWTFASSRAQAFLRERASTPLILRGMRERGIASCLPTLPVAGRA